MVTLRDVAAAARVSAGTVSRVLNGKGDQFGISQDTQARILEAARQLNYVPNRHARNLRLRRQRDTVCFLTVGPLSRMIISPFFSPVIHALEEHVSKRGLRLHYLRLDLGRGRAGSSLPSPHTIFTSDVRAVVTIGRLSDHLIEYINAAGVSIVGIEPYSSQVEPAVYVDNYGGVRQAVSHVVKGGCRRLGLVVPVSPDGEIHPPYRERRDAFIELTERLRSRSAICSAVCREVVAADDVTDSPSAYRGILDLLQTEDLDALICLSDVWAAEALRAAQAAGRRVPDDLSVVGFDNLYWTPYTAPPLTTVEIPADEMASTVVRLLLGDPDCTGRKSVRIGTKLVVRRSTRCVE